MKISIDNHSYYNFKEIRGYINFMHHPSELLKNTLEDFFSVEVNYNFSPLLDNDLLALIQNNPKRNVYVDNNNQVSLLITVNPISDAHYLFVIQLKGNSIGLENRPKIFNVMASCISKSLTESYADSFTKAIWLLGDVLIKRFISLFVGKGVYNFYKIHSSIDFFTRLRSTTFEGKYFSSGLIVTKSIYDYKDSSNNHFGILQSLYTCSKLFSRIDTRYWYLVDGYSSFYLTDLKKDIHYVFINSDTDPSYLNRVLLKNVLMGSDLLFRVENGRDLSIVTSKGYEFIHQENVWRFRNYDMLQALIQAKVKLSDSVYNSLLYYVLYCSKHDISSIIWVPAYISKVQPLLKSFHSFTRSSFNIMDRNYSGLVKRMMSSDGATIISVDGTVKYYGCIVNMDSAKVNAVKGTGETVASLLASNGVAFKISQDGTIKVFLNEGKGGCIKF